MKPKNGAVELSSAILPEAKAEIQTRGVGAELKRSNAKGVTDHGKSSHEACMQPSRALAGTWRGGSTGGKVRGGCKHP